VPRYQQDDAVSVADPLGNRGAPLLASIDVVTIEPNVVTGGLVVGANPIAQGAVLRE
jgi:hypothetical protein